jgi:hypothetical protein
MNARIIALCEAAKNGGSAPEPPIDS